MCFFRLLCVCVSARLFGCVFVCLLVSVRGDVHAKLWISGLVYQTIRIMKSSTSLPGGNQVDGLPPASSFKVAVFQGVAFFCGRKCKMKFQKSKLQRKQHEMNLISLCHL